MFEKDLSLSLYYDVYAPLLSEKKREVFEAYYLEDLSLSEIASSTGTSRQAVRDLISHTEDQLSEFENELGLIKKKKKIESLLDSAQNCDDKERIKIFDEIKQLL